MGKPYRERGVFICDEEAKNIYTNKAYQEMTGCTREELLGLGWTSCIHPKDLPVKTQSTPKILSPQVAFFLELSNKILC
jgi:PAS domain S-box-containing protein